MSVYTSRPLDTLRLLASGLLVAACLFLVSVLISAISTFNSSASAQGRQAEPTAVTGLYEDPNVIAGGMVAAIGSAGQSAEVFSAALQDSFVSTAQAIGSSIGSGITSTGRIARTSAGLSLRAVAGMYSFHLHYAGQAAGLALHGVSSVFGFVGDVAGGAISGIARLTHIDAIIRPADDTDVPIIDPDSPELAAALAAMPASEQKPQSAGSAAPQSGANAGPAWPIHGDITTLFGVPHWPYQPTHTGIDISDGKAPGVTPVKAFRAGKVTDVIHSNRGLGNHVIVDHGSGVSSVYAHLHSTNVQTGQSVDTGTVLGLEGSTGASTGTHLHFEIRVNGQAADPRQFVNGQP